MAWILAQVEHLLNNTAIKKGPKKLWSSYQNNHPNILSITTGVTILCGKQYAPFFVQIWISSSEESDRPGQARKLREDMEGKGAI